MYQYAWSPTGCHILASDVENPTRLGLSPPAQSHLPSLLLLESYTVPRTCHVIRIMPLHALYPVLQVLSLLFLCTNVMNSYLSLPVKHSLTCIGRSDYSFLWASFNPVNPINPLYLSVLFTLFSSHHFAYVFHTLDCLLLLNINIVTPITLCSYWHIQTFNKCLLNRIEMEAKDDSVKELEMEKSLEREICTWHREDAQK